MAPLVLIARPELADLKRQNEVFVGRVVAEAVSALDAAVFAVDDELTMVLLHLPCSSAKSGLPLRPFNAILSPMKLPPNTYQLPGRMKRTGVGALPERPASLRWLPPVLMLLGYTCIWFCISVAMVMYAASDASWPQRLLSVALTWMGPLLLLGAVILTFGQAAERGWRLWQVFLVLLSLPGMLMLVPAVLMLGDALGG